MMINQDDLYALRQFRLIASNCPAQRYEVDAALHEYPGRAAGRHAFGALDRAVTILERFGRRPGTFGDGAAPNAEERRLLTVLKELRAGDRIAAAAAATWLVRASAVERLLDALGPAVMMLPPHGVAAPRRRMMKRV